MSDLFFYTMVGAFVGGVAVGSFFSISLPLVAWLLGLALITALGACRSEKLISRQILLFFSVCLFCGSVGMLRVELQTPVVKPSLSQQLGEKIELEGVVVREPENRAYTTHLYVEAEGVIFLIFADPFVPVEYGDLINFGGELSLPENFETDLGRTFNYSGYLAARGVGYIISFAEVELIEKAAGNKFLIRLYRGKSSFIEQLENILPAPQVGLGEGLLLGVKQALGDDLETAFRRSGLIHIVVLSGYNVMLVVTFFMYVLSYVLPYRLRLLVGIVAITVFALLVGLSATVLRASVMAALLLLLRFSNHTYHVLRALMLAGIIMLLLNPYLLLYDIGFQLSFMATTGLILLAEPVSNYLHRVPKLFGLREFLTATLVTQFFVLPLLLYHIGEVSIVSIIANVLVLPIVPVAMMLTFITGVLGWVWSPVAYICGYLAYLSLQYIIIVTQTLAGTPLATVSVPAFSEWFLLIGYVFIATFAYLIISKKVTNKETSKHKSIKKLDYDSWEIVAEEDVLQKIHNQ